MKDDGGNCVLLFDSYTDSYLILGQPFFMHYYMEFDHSNGQVGVTQSINALQQTNWTLIIILIILAIVAIGFIIFLIRRNRQQKEKAEEDKQRRIEEDTRKAEEKRA